MSDRINPVRQIVMDAVERGEALEISRIRTLRAQSRQAVVLFKGIFWVSIVVFNLALWAPLPFAISKSVLYPIAFVVLLVGLVVPILGLRKHQMNLELLKLNKQPLKKKTANETARVYIDQVKKQDRPFVNAEYELLHGSKWQEKAEETHG